MTMFDQQPPPSPFGRIPPEQRATIMRLYDEGQTLEQIGKATGRTASAVTAALQRWRVRRDRRLPSKCEDPTFLAMRRSGKSAREIAETLGVRSRQVESWIHEALKKGLIEAHNPNRRIRWNDQQVEKLKAFWANGLGPSAIAQEMEFTPSAISAKARLLGLPKASYPATRRVAVGRDYSHLRRAANAARDQMAKVRAEAIEARKAEAARLWLVVDGAKPFLERGVRECSWPLGERGNYAACCKSTAPGETYCAHHRMIAGGQRLPEEYRAARAPRPAQRGRPSVFDQTALGGGA